MAILGGYMHTPSRYQSTGRVASDSARKRSDFIKSRKGCLTCRSRKLKCNEAKPVCGPCQKSHRSCRESSDQLFRHHHNASVSAESRSSGGQQNSRARHVVTHTFDDNHVWLGVPKQSLTFIGAPADTESSELPGLESLLFTSSDDSDSEVSQRKYQDPFTPPDSNTLDIFYIESSIVEPRWELEEHTFIYPPRIDDSNHEKFDSRLRQNSPLFTVSDNLDSELSRREDEARSFTPSDLNTLDVFDIESGVVEPQGELEERTFIFPPYVDESSDQKSDSRLRQHSPNCIVSVDGGSQGHKTPEFEYSLIRRYSEVTAKWIDLFDCDSYFSTRVSNKATSFPLLKYAVLALAAKQFGLGKDVRLARQRDTRAFDITLVAQFPNIDWQYEAEIYYNKAISLLNKVLQKYGHLGWNFSVTNFEDSLRATVVSKESIGEPKNALLSSDYFDDILSTTAILCVYEFIDASDVPWASHLNGIRSLLDVGGMQSPRKNAHSLAMEPTASFKLSTSRKATFWHFARQDLVAAFTNGCHTRLDSEDFSIWRAAGLSINEEGYIQQNIRTREDMVSNGLVWLLSRIVNYLSANDGVLSTRGQMASLENPVSTNEVSQSQLFDRWHRLEEELRVWSSSLPSSFNEVATIDSSYNWQGGKLDEPSPVPIIWYSMSICASSMQSYHMARIILLINKTYKPVVCHTALHERIEQYRRATQMAEDHARKICGIAFSRPDEAARIHMIQPLFVAGQCLRGGEERKAVIYHLREIEEELGWSTRVCIDQLLNQWRS